MNAGGTGFQIARGTGGIGTATGTITFPFTFTNVPIVTATTAGLNTSVVYSLTVNTITTTGFNYIKNYLPTGGSVTPQTVEGFYWIALG